MVVIGVDDTDSMTHGMCTTYVGHTIANKISNETEYDVQRVLLVRLNPAAKHKTRGNAAVAIHIETDEIDQLHNIATNVTFSLAAGKDSNTNPAVVTASDDTATEFTDFTHKAITELLSIEQAKSVLNQHRNVKTSWKGNGRGRIGSLAAIGSYYSLVDWTYEHIFYREEQSWGTERNFDHESVFDAADYGYPDVWDTVDRVQGDVVCIPRTPCPILYGIRGDDKNKVKEVGQRINSEPISSSQLFLTNQGTDAHLINSSITDATENSAYEIDCQVTENPETIEGGHVFFTVTDGTSQLSVAAFEPTKHFRDVVRKLRKGDNLTVCGEIKQGTLKLEKMKVRSLNQTKKVNPSCPSCGNNMSSAGRNQGYRCRDCNTHQNQLETISVDRTIEHGWYEVPPCARRHIAKPLTRMTNTSNKTHPYK